MFASAINKFLIGEKKGTAGAVCGKDGGVWGHSDTLSLNREEVLRAKQVFNQAKNKSVKELLSVQFSLRGVSFFVTSCHIDDYNAEIQAEAIDYDSGCSLVLLNSGFVIGYYDSPVTAYDNLLATRKLATHVSELGY
ncbi:Profilin [Entamoeba marina]